MQTHITIPSEYRQLRYNLNTREIYFYDKLYAKIKGGVYTTYHRNMPKKYVYWDMAIVNYFHPKILTFSINTLLHKNTYTIDCAILLRYGTQIKVQKYVGLKRIPLIDMEKLYD